MKTRTLNPNGYTKYKDLFLKKHKTTGLHKALEILVCSNIPIVLGYYWLYREGHEGYQDKVRKLEQFYGYDVKE